MRRSRQELVVKAVTLLVVLGGWEIAGRFVNPLFLSSPSAIAVAFYSLMGSGELPQAIASSLLAFYAWWGSQLPSPRLALAAFAVAVSGICCDVSAESLYIGWLPRDLATVGPLATLLTGGAANGLYTVAGMMLTLGTPSLRGRLRAWTWAVWASGAGLTASALAGSVTGMIVSTGIMMPMFCPWVVVLGRHLGSSDGRRI